MINLIVNGEPVSYDSVDDARAAARTSGGGVFFWRETLKACEQDDAVWNELVSEIADSGGEALADELAVCFNGFERRHWELAASIINGGGFLADFFGAWREDGALVAMSVVRDRGFLLWLQRKDPARYALMQSAFGKNLDRYNGECIFASFLRIEESKIVPVVDMGVQRFAQCVEDALSNPCAAGGRLIDFLEHEECWLLADEKDREVERWARKIGVAGERTASQMLCREDFEAPSGVFKNWQ